MFFYLRKNSHKNVNIGLVGTSSLLLILICYLTEKLLMVLVRGTSLTHKFCLLNFENKNC